MEGHPELEAEQAHVDRAYDRVDELRARTRELLSSVLGQSRGGTPQSRQERDVVVRTSLARLEQLDVGDQALVFGRIDRLGGAERDGEAGAPGRQAPDGQAPGQQEVETFHLGRLGISSQDQEPIVVDWRAPVAEPFYRATGRDPMGLVLRRHIAATGRRVTGIEDERFAPGPVVMGGTPSGTTERVEEWATDGSRRAEGSLEEDLGREMGGPAALLAALTDPRSGHMRDIVSTIQGEQDEIVRAPLAGVLVVEGGPGTGKTAVALHRAAYLLYTHRFPLERQGVLVIGPNPLFLRYIEHVLPSLGESGVTLSTVDGLVHGMEARAQESFGVSRLKGEVRMAQVLSRAVKSRQRPLRDDLSVPYGATVLRLSAAQSATIVSAARRRPGTHNSRRRFVEELLARRLAEDYLRILSVHSVVRTGSAGAEKSAEESAEVEGPPEEFDLAEFSRQIRRLPEVTEALQRMWPRLSAEELLHDLFGSRPLVSLAAGGLLSREEQSALYRPRESSLAGIPWTSADVALVDEARVLLGPRRGRSRTGATESDEAPRTYGHIVVDEAQDLSPMQLRMVSRRSLSGSITAVGDIAQATGPWAPDDWDQVTAHLPERRAPRVMTLSVSYRTPAEVVEVASRVLAIAAPQLRPPVAVRRSGVAPRFVRAATGDLARVAAEVASDLVAEVSPGTTAVLGPSSLVAELAKALDSTGVQSADPRSEGLGAPLSLLPVDLANGLEFDAVVVVEPASLLEESAQGARALYMALSRPTRRLAVVHERSLPAALAG